MAPDIIENGWGNAAFAIALERPALGVDQGAVVLDQTFERLLAEVEPIEVGVAPLQLRDQAQALAVVLEAAEIAHAGVERVLAGVAERGMAEIVPQRHRLGQIVVEAERPGERAGDLRDLDRMGEARAEMIALVIDEHLGLVGEPSERGRMDDSIAVALKRSAGRRGRLGKQAPSRGLGVGGVRRSDGHAGSLHPSASHCVLPCEAYLKTDFIANSRPWM